MKIFYEPNLISIIEDIWHFRFYNHCEKVVERNISPHYKEELLNLCNFGLPCNGNRLPCKTVNSVSESVYTGVAWPSAREENEWKWDSDLSSPLRAKIHSDMILQLTMWTIYKQWICKNGNLTKHQSWLHVPEKSCRR